MAGADFFLGVGEGAEWLGTLRLQGDPDDLPRALREARWPSEYRRLVAALLRSRVDGVRPHQGWPWGWDTANGTPHVYTFSSMGWQGVGALGETGWMTVEAYAAQWAAGAPRLYARLPDMRIARVFAPRRRSA